MWLVLWLLLAILAAASPPPPEWEGTWVSTDSDLESNVYHMLHVEGVSVLGFRYGFECREVPYGPNAVWTEGTAVFRDAGEAVDLATGTSFLLGEGAVEVDPPPECYVTDAAPRGSV